MERVVVQIKRGITAGKWRARFENYGEFISLGVADTEAEAWEMFNDFSDEVVKEKIVKFPKKSYRKKTRADWDRISKDQIKILSAKYL